MTEDALLSTFFDWVRWEANSDPRFNYVVHIPNEGKRSWAEGKRMKRKGLSAGLPDVLVLLSPGLALEAKVGKNKLTQAQYEWRLKLLAAGWQWEEFRSFEQGKEILTSYFKSVKLGA